jgi:hypothetical protein
MFRTLGGAADGTGVPAHGDSLLVLLDVLEELNGALKLPSVDGLSRLARVLERDTEVGTARAGGLRRLDLGGSVTGLMAIKMSVFLFQRPACVVVVGRICAQER